MTNLESFKLHGALMTTNTPSLISLPPDVLLSILALLHPTDITCLRAVFPPSSLARALTHDPCLWRRLFRQHFPRAMGYPYPRLVVTSDGRLDWHAAYLEATRRRQALNIHHSRQKHQYPPFNSPCASQHPSPPLTNATPANIRIELRGNIHRIISASAESGAANVTWDDHIAAARFDWTGRARPLPPPCASRRSIYHPRTPQRDGKD